MKKTVVLGASPNLNRTSFTAVEKLLAHGHEVVAIGNRSGYIMSTPIVIGQPELKDVDTVTLYLNPTIQKEYYDYVIGLKPKRIIFNPGSENSEFVQLAKENGIEPVIACTLVMLSLGSF